DFDIAGGDRVVGVAVWAIGYRPDDPQTVFGSQLVGDRLIAYDDLGDAGGIAQVDERHSPMVAPARDPASERDLGAGVSGAQAAGIVRADHVRYSLMRGRKSEAGGVQACGSATSCSPERMSLT